MDKKYKLTKETKQYFGRTLYRIESLRDFSNVSKGDLGGWLESEKNLSHEGNCWIYDNGWVCDNGVVYGNGQVFNNGRVCGDGMVRDNGVVCGDGKVCGDDSVCNYETKGSEPITKPTETIEEPIKIAPFKDDSQKPPLDLIPPRALAEVAKCMQYGATKYGQYNFLSQTGFNYTRLIAAALRHINSFQCGEDIADDTKQSHLAHAAACMLMLLETIRVGKGTDDRYKVEEKV